MPGHPDPRLPEDLLGRRREQAVVVARWLDGNDHLPAEEPALPDDHDPRTLLAQSRLGVLATIKRDGLPQLSPVTPFYDREAGTITISMTEGRAKTANLRRDPRAAVEVTSADGRGWATAEGPVTLVGPGTDPHGPEVETLVAYYRAAAGEHPDWEEYRATMVADRRVLATLTVERVYGERIGGSPTG